MESDKYYNRHKNMKSDREKERERQTGEWRGEGYSESTGKAGVRLTSLPAWWRPFATASSRAWSCSWGGRVQPKQKLDQRQHSTSGVLRWLTHLDDFHIRWTNIYEATSNNFFVSAKQSRKLSTFLILCYSEGNIFLH